LNLRQNRYERYVLPLNYKPKTAEKKIFDFMRNISISQFIVVFFIAVLLFSDFSKVIKRFHNPIKNTKIYKNLKKK